MSRKSSPPPDPMHGLCPRTFYRRYEDMSPDGYLSVLIEDDGDVILTVCEDSAHPRLASVQFCTAFGGGGQSPKVREALLRLAQAIREENETNPQRGREE